jgi:pseudaminic acid biosynthesis-associated methylase
VILNEQQNFWANVYAEDYKNRNQNFNSLLGVHGWEKMLAKTNGIGSILECGCNIGRNIGFLNQFLPLATKSIIEISKPAYQFVTNRYKLDQTFHGSIEESSFLKKFDLVFTMGVLIHIHPDDLLVNMNKIFSYSKKYILLGEYFNRTPVMLKYRGEVDKLFKQDFGKLFIENFSVQLVDYGFLWGYEYDSAGFDDITWWLFERKG